MLKGLQNMWTGLHNALVKHKIFASLIVVGTVVILGGALFAGRSNSPAQAAPPPLAVEVIQVEHKDVPIYSEWIGTTDGMVNADIKAQVTGYLLRQSYKEGSLVKKGELLFEIDPRPFQAALEQANGQVAQFEGQLEQAISQVTQAEAQVAQANSQLLQAQAQMSQRQANQVKTQLDVNKYAPLAEQKAVTQQTMTTQPRLTLPPKLRWRQRKPVSRLRVHSFEWLTRRSELPKRRSQLPKDKLKTREQLLKRPRSI